jgi:hypothetical protein
MRKIVILLVILSASSLAVFSQDNNSNSKEFNEVEFKRWQDSLKKVSDERNKLKELYQTVKNLKKEGKENEIIDFLTKSFQGTKREKLWKTYCDMYPQKNSFFTDTNGYLGKDHIGFYSLFCHDNNGEIRVGIRIVKISHNTNAIEETCGYLFMDPVFISRVRYDEKEISEDLFFYILKEIKEFH